MSSRNEALRRFRAAQESVRLARGWTPDAWAPRLNQGELPWSYDSLARAALANARMALDMGTGGGEFISSLGPFPRELIATEGWLPNVSVAGTRLLGLGVSVIAAGSLRLPFADETFDVVLDRHEELDPGETARVLRAGGALITQQVDEEQWRELERFFPRKTSFQGLFDAYVRGFKAAGLVIVRAERCIYPAAYASVEDLVRLFVRAPWTIPDFDVEKDIDALIALEQDLCTDDGVALTEGRFLIVAQRPPGDS